jgi:integrase
MIAMWEDIIMATQPTPLKASAHHGYDSWTTTWRDDQGHRRGKRFGKVGEVTRKAALARFNNWLRNEWESKPTVRNPEDPNLYTVNMLADQYQRHAETIYRKNGKLTSHIEQVKSALDALRKTFGDSPVEMVGAPQIVRLRDAMVYSTDRKGNASKLTASTVNGRLRIIRQAFVWGRLYSSVPAAVAYDVSLVKPLRPGRNDAKPSKIVAPVPEDVFRATLKETPQTVADMAWLQYWTGMRSGEVCQLRVCDIQANGDVWLYKPLSHKSEHQGKVRVVAIGPNGQKVLAPYIAKRKLNEYVFLPEDAHRERLERIGFAKVMAYQMSRSTFKPGRCFRGETYYNKIAYACDRAFDPEGEKRAAGDYSHRWHPHRLRHNAATRMRAALGIEAASDVLGHSGFSTTLIYAERSLERAKEAARKVG